MIQRFRLCLRITAYAPLQRTGEFGLRIALRADPGMIGRIVARDALELMAIGISIGLPAASPAD